MPRFVIKPEVVSDAIREVRQLKVHPHFAGYLGIVRASAIQGTEEGIRFDYWEFFNTFFKIPDAPERRPYLNLFTLSKPAPANLWGNENVAGSYAPSSIRSGQALSKVVTTGGARNAKTYSLQANHWELARAHLTYGEKLPVIPIATYLFRDFALTSDEPTAKTLVSVFREEFGYNSDEVSSVRFEHLFVDDSDTRTTDDWFEEVP